MNKNICLLDVVPCCELPPGLPLPAAGASHRHVNKRMLNRRPVLGFYRHIRTCAKHQQNTPFRLCEDLVYRADLVHVETTFLQGDLHSHRGLTKAPIPKEGWGWS